MSFNLVVRMLFSSSQVFVCSLFSSITTVIQVRFDDPCFGLEPGLPLVFRSTLELFPFDLSLLFDSWRGIANFARCVLLDASRRLVWVSAAFEGLDDGDGLFDVCIVSAMPCVLTAAKKTEASKCSAANEKIMRKGRTKNEDAMRLSRKMEVCGGGVRRKIREEAVMMYV